MKPYLLISLVLCLMTVTAHSETMYVSDTITITVRKGPGIKYQVIKEIESGQIVKTLKTENGWTKITLSENEEGWVLSHFLTSEKPAASELADLQKKYDMLLAQIRDLRQEKPIPDKADASVTGADKTDTLSDFRLEYQRSQRLLKEKTRQIEILEKELTTLRTERNMTATRIRWFLAGAGVLLLGVFTGYLARHQRYLGGFRSR